jgi:hypothetical protein
MRGNTNNQKSQNNPAYVDAYSVRNTAFQTVIKLKPDKSLFPWTSVSHLGIGLLEKAIDEMAERASSLTPKPSSDEISNLKKDVESFRDAVRGYNSVKKKLNPTKH